MELHGETPPRPYTHDLLAAVVRGVGWKLDRVTITDVRDNTFYALLALTHEGQLVEVDARPSDSIAIALRLDAQIFVDDAVLERAEWHAERVDQAPDDVETFQQLMAGVRISEQPPEEEPPPPAPEEPLQEA
jgi:bifunctional DNase/RNase